MKTLTSIAQSALVVTVGVVLVACTNMSTRTKSAEVVSLFVDARPYLGQKVTIKGYLRYEFENRNLFPVSNRGGEGRQQYCLPVLIERENQNLLAQANHLNGEIVTVTGIIVDPTPPGSMPLGMCKPIGLAPDSIKSAK